MIWGFLRPLVWCDSRYSPGDGYGDGYGDGLSDDTGDGCGLGDDFVNDWGRGEDD